jgi:hypothetical protein
MMLRFVAIPTEQATEIACKWHAGDRLRAAGRRNSSGDTSRQRDTVSGILAGR